MRRARNRAVLRAVGWSVLVLWTGCREDILHNLDELQANEAIVLLEQQGIGSDKRRDSDGWSVSVAGSDFGGALAALSGDFALRVRPKPARERSFFPGEEERLLMREREIAERLEETLEQFPGVIEARVHLHLSAPGLLGQSAGEDSASVFLLRTSGAKPLDVASIQQLVAGGAGVSTGSVTTVEAEAAEESAGERPSLPNTPRVSSPALPLALVSIALVTVGVWFRGSARPRRLRPPASGRA